MALKNMRKDVFITAFIMVVAIFLVGFYLGGKLDTYRISDIDELLNNVDLDIQGLEGENDFYSIFSENSCDIYITQLSSFRKSLAKMGQKLSDYDAKKLQHEKYYNLLKRKYIVSELRFYNLKKKIDEGCPSKEPIILFFYDTVNNEKSLRQGYVLDNIVNKNLNISVLSFDINFDDIVVHALTDFYDINSAPTMIVNYENKIETFKSEVELRAIVEN